MLQETPAAANPLGVQPIGRLLTKFAVPSIVSFLVSALYNIVDQIFIGQGVGTIGNAATNVAFPLTTISVATALLFGIGTAANFNLSLGAGDRERATRILGTGLSCLVLFGLALGAVVLIFLRPLLAAFGATAENYSYAQTYAGITAFCLPLVVFSSGSSHLIRADGSPRYSMLCMVSGAIVNTILDPLFIFGFDMGIAGAALDVFRTEPLPPDSPLLAQPGLFLTPHVAAAVEQAVQGSCRAACQGVVEVLTGQPVTWPANHPLPVQE